MTAGWFTRLDPEPDVYAIVMASGIVSIAAMDHHYTILSTGFLVVAALAYVLLSLGFLIRASTDPARVVRLTRDPDVALRMFTFVSASTVLDVRWPGPGVLRWVLGVVALTGWCVLVPLAGADVASRSTALLRAQAHGAWLLPSVATSGLTIIAADLAVQRNSYWLLDVALGGWGLALVAYLAVTVLIICRVTSARFRVSELAPDSWILMGALAIAALAGAHIHAGAVTLGGQPMLVTTSHVLMLAPLLAASVWIPLLLYAEMWRADHVIGALRYHRAWWSAIFPVGMYSAASYYCAQQLPAPALHTVSLVFFWIASTLWVMVAVGLIHTATTHRPRAEWRPDP